MFLFPRSGRRQDCQPVSTPLSSPSHSKTKSFVDLPLELASAVLVQLDFGDLLSLRVTSKSISFLIAQDVILKPWLKRHIHTIQLQLSPPPQHDLWKYVVEQGRSWSVANNTASLMFHHIDRKILLHLFLKTRLTILPTTAYRAAQHNLKDPAVLSSIIFTLTERLLLLDHYLKTCRSQLVVHLHKISQLGAWDHITPSLFEICTASPDIYDRFTDQQIHDVHSLWLFLVDTLRKLTQRPEFMGTLEAMIKGLNQKPLDSNTLALGLVIGGCTTIKSMFQLSNFCTRKKFMMESLAGFPLEVQHRLISVSDQHSVAGSRILLHQLWVNGMIGCMMTRDLPAGDVVVRSTSFTTIKLMRELAGFDIFASDEIVEPTMHTDMFGMPR